MTYWSITYVPEYTYYFICQSLQVGTITSFCLKGIKPFKNPTNDRNTTNESNSDAGNS